MMTCQNLQLKPKRMEQSSNTEEKKGRNMLKKRRSDFLQEHCEMYPYVKKWYSKGFYPTIRMDENTGGHASGIIMDGGVGC